MQQMKLFALMFSILLLGACSSISRIEDPLGVALAMEQQKEAPKTIESLEAEIQDKKTHLSLLQEQVFHQMYSGHIKDLEEQIFQLEAQKAELMHEKPQKNSSL